MNAVVKMHIGVKSAKRNHAVLWKPTTIYTNTFDLTTDLDTYLTDLDAFCTTVYDFVAVERAALAETTTHYRVWLDNPTHPPTAAGVIKLPKGHLDGALSDLEFLTSTDLKDTISLVVANLRTNAKY